MRSGGAVVHQRVGLQRDQRVDIVDGHDADCRLESTDLADVEAHLVGVAHTDADELEQRMPDDLRNNHPADEPGAPHDDPFGHRLTIGPRRLRSALVPPSTKWVLVDELFDGRCYPGQWC